MDYGIEVSDISSSLELNWSKYLYDFFVVHYFISISILNLFHFFTFKSNVLQAKKSPVIDPNQAKNTTAPGLRHEQLLVARMRLELHTRNYFLFSKQNPVVVV